MRQFSDLKVAIQMKDIKPYITVTLSIYYAGQESSNFLLKSEEEILKCDHSSESYREELSFKVLFAFWKTWQCWDWSLRNLFPISLPTNHCVSFTYAILGTDLKEITCQLT